MCGIIGIVLSADSDDPMVQPYLLDGLTVLQHRGQDAAGMVTSDGHRLRLRKDMGLVRDVFASVEGVLPGHVGLGHCRYPTAGSSSSVAEAQPLYTNTPFGICGVHNGNLTNARELFKRIQSKRHINTDSDSELLLNWFAEHLNTALLSASNNNNTNGNHKDITQAVFNAMTQLMADCKGGYAGLFLIHGVGVVGFRDPHGIRPLVLGERSAASNGKMEYIMCSESVAMDTLGFSLVRDIAPGEALFIDMQNGKEHTLTSHTVSPTPHPQSHPCIFEYVYFARPDSIMDGVSVYQARLHMGTRLAHKILREHPDHDIDVVIPIPDTSRSSALQAATVLQRPYREGFMKNRYIARTFIMPGQATRRKAVRLKLNTMKSEFRNKNVLLVDDSIVRGTTATEIINMAREAGAKRVFLCSAAPPILYPNIYGIDIPTQKELIAHNRTPEQIAQKLGCDWVVYQDLEDLQHAVRSAADSTVGTTSATTTPLLEQFETSCFSGEYVTGESIEDIAYFAELHNSRNDEAQRMKRNGLAGVPDHTTVSAIEATTSATMCETLTPT